MAEEALDPELQRICLEITRKLRQYPAAKLFNDPVDPKKDNVPDYFKKIKNPQDLGSIYQRLEAGEYKSLAQWEHDINTVWSNAEIYHGGRGTPADTCIPVICAARYMSSRFKSLKKSLMTHSVDGWAKHLYDLGKEFDHLLSTCPPGLQAVIPKSLDDTTSTLMKFSARDIANLMKASEMVNQPTDIEQIAAILKKNEPQMNIGEEDLVLDVNSLSLPTLHEIRAYYKKQLMDQGLPYPNNA